MVWEPIGSRMEQVKRLRTVMKLGAVLFAALSLSPFSASALDSRAVFAGGGWLSHGLNATTSDRSGEVDFLGPVYFHGSAASEIGLLFPWYARPQLTVTFPKEGPDSSYQTWLLHASLPAARTWGAKGFFYTFGPGLMLYSITGDGGTVQTYNGTSQAVFARPGRTRRAWLGTLALAAGWERSFWRLQIESWMTQPFSEDKRSYSVLFSVQARIWDFNSAQKREPAGGQDGI